MTPPSVVLAGGGTAGHIEPMLALADALSRRPEPPRITCLGTERGMETRLVPARGYDLRLIPPVPLPRKPTPDLLRVPGRVVRSVRATRAASEDALIAASLPRLDAMLAEGITTLEIKSGYGLTLADESKQLRVARTLGQLRAVEIVPPLLGAHAAARQNHPHRVLETDLAREPMDAAGEAKVQVSLLPLTNGRQSYTVIVGAEPERT